MFYVYVLSTGCQPRFPGVILRDLEERERNLFHMVVVLQREMVMKPGKHQRRKQRWQDLCWKVHDRAQSFVLRSYSMHELRNQHVSIG